MDDDSRVLEATDREVVVVVVVGLGGCSRVLPAADGWAATVLAEVRRAAGVEVEGR